MGKKWTYCAVYSIIQIQFVRGIWEGIVNAREDIYAVPGSDVNLTCQTQTKSFLVQMQWSKITDKVDLIALYHPQFGFHCGHRSPCESVVASIETSGNVTKWTLHLRNISSLLSGKYECSFTLYPEGFQTKIYNLLLQTSVTQEEWRSNYTIEIEINQTLEIPCIQNISSEISSKFTFAWLVEDNGTQEALITKDHISSSTPFKDRVKLDVDGGLHLSPVHIHDDGKKFSCRLTVRTDKILRSSTTVKVFAKPEIPTIVENNTMEVLGEKIFTCSLKNVFPKANLTWLIDGRFLQGEEEGIYIANEERKGMSGFWELKSVLTRMHGNKPVISNNLTIWCMALSPIPGNKMWYTSSEKITFSLGSVNTTTDPQLSVTESTPGTQPFPANSVTPTKYPAVSSNTLTDGSASTPHTTPQTVSQVPSETHTSSTTDASSTFHDDVFTSTTREFSEVPTTANGATKNNHSHITSTVANKPKDGMSWPVIIAVLLFFCLVLFGLGVRKWCQYQKEIMERPPPFKPPPPPIKYMCIQEAIGSDLPCHEMETL